MSIFLTASSHELSSHSAYVEGHQNQNRLSMNSTNTSFFEGVEPQRQYDREDDQALTMMTLGQSSQIPQSTFGDDEDEFEPPQAQPGVRRNPARNAPRPWCGSYRRR